MDIIEILGSGGGGALISSLYTKYISGRHEQRLDILEKKVDGNREDDLKNQGKIDNFDKEITAIHEKLNKIETTQETRLRQNTQIETKLDNLTEVLKEIKEKFEKSLEKSQRNELQLMHLKSKLDI